MLDLCDGLDDVRAAVAGYAPETVAARTGVGAGVIRELACEVAEAPTAVVYGRVGVSTQEFGGLCCWLINVLNLLSGNFDRAGGASMMPTLKGSLRRADSSGHAQPVPPG